jgi:uncharacterized OsmC-like protein
MAATDIRRYEATTRSSDVFGRVLVDARDQHLVVDGPVQNGCPGEAITPGEMFLAGVASCAVELVQVIAREEGIEVGPVRVAIDGTIDRANPVRLDYNVFNQVRMRVELEGVAEEQGRFLIDRFRAR